MIASGRPGDRSCPTSSRRPSRRRIIGHGWPALTILQVMLLDVEHDQQEGDVQVQHAAVVELVIELADDPGRVGIALEEEPDLGRELGGQQGRRHPLADDVPDGDRPAGRASPGSGGTAGPIGKKP